MPHISYIRQRNLQARNGSKKVSSINQRSSAKSLMGKLSKKSDEYREVMVTDAPTSVQGLALPGGAAAFRALVSARFCAAVWCHITDCDEVFNYWEPLHYLTYGWGLQTWEYSAEFALRSYASLWVAGAPAALLGSGAGAPVAFYVTRCVLALAAASADLYFYKAVSQEFGVQVARLWLALTLPSAGSFISSAAFLPSAWCSTLSTLALAAWWRRNYPVAVVAVAVSTLMGWPFAALLGAPIALDLMFRQPQQLLTLLRWSLLSVTFVLGPVVYIDSLYYGRLVIAPWNLIKYNIFTEHGPDLYGVESWTFYFVNGFLNYNVIWIMALLCPFLLLAYHASSSTRPRAYFCKPYVLSLLPLYSWLLVFFSQPHKEERFLFPVYSMICLCGAIGVDCSQKLYFRYRPWLGALATRLAGTRGASRPVPQENQGQHYAQRTTHIMVAFIIIATTLSVSRSVALYRNYHSPMDVLRGLSEAPPPGQSAVTVCYGKEWHRFPSSFLFPEPRYRVGFVRSHFKGMLPAYYSQLDNATLLSPDHFNDMNLEEERLYTDISDCHYLVSSTVGEVSPEEPDYSLDTDKWTVVSSLPLLDTAKSDKFFRAFYIPTLSDMHVTFGEIQLLRSTKLKVN